MTFKAIKKLTGQAIVDDNACSTDAEKFIKKFGFYTEVEWTDEVETWISENISAGIKWLKEKDFITIEDVIDEDDMIFFKVPQTSDPKQPIYKLCKTDYNKWQWCCIDNDANFFGGTIFTSRKEAIEYINKTSQFNLKSFKSVTEAIDFYSGNDGDIKNKTLIQKIYDSMDDGDYVEAMCEALCDSEICDNKCSGCPFN